MRIAPMACSALFLATVSCAVVALGSGVNADSSTSSGQAAAEPAKIATATEVTARIDEALAKTWADQKVTPAKPAGDEEFLRRVYFDTVGVPPTVDEARKFLDDKAADKRARLIDTLLADARFGRHIADEWLPVLMGRGAGKDKGKGMVQDLLAVWLAEQFNKNRDFGQVAYDIITASGSMSENLAVAYWATRREQKVPDFAGLVSKQFTGVQIQCAQCHKHPYEKWTMEDFAGVASFFQPVNIRQNNDSYPLDPTVVDQRVRKRARESEKPAKPEDVRYYDPRYLGGDAVAINDSTLWRSAYAKWVISPENTQTHRYLVNRFWSFMFGLGFVNPIDDFNSVNKVQHPELLEMLAQDFAASKFDVKRFYRIALNTRAYQLASSGATRTEGKVEGWMFAEYPVRQLSPEQLFGGLVTVAGDGQIERDFRRDAGNPFTVLRMRSERGERRKDKGAMEGEDASKDAKKEKKKDKEFDEKANAVFEKAIEDMTDVWFLRRRLSSAYAAQSSDDEMTDADCFSMTIDQALMVMNGLATQTIAGTYKGSCLQTVMSQNTSAEDRMKALFLHVLTRKPTERELNRFTDFISRESKSRKAEDVYADVLLALLMTTEFATNH